MLGSSGYFLSPIEQYRPHFPHPRNKQTTINAKYALRSLNDSKLKKSHMEWLKLKMKLGTLF